MAGPGGSILGSFRRTVNLPPPEGSALRAAVAQMHPRLGDLEANLALHREWIRRAREAKVDLLVFPELSLTGYALRDLAPGMAVPLKGGPLEALAKEAGRMTVVVGAVLAARTGLPSNAGVILEGGRAAFAHRKVYLPDHGMFEEGRYFSPGDRFRVHRSKALGMAAGILVCRDLWHPSAGVVLGYRGLDLLIAMSASPGRDLRGDAGEDPGFGSLQMLRILNEASARTLGVFVVHANRVGTEEGVTFAGGSDILAPTGALLARAPEGEEALVTADLDPDLLRRARTALPLERDEQRDLTAREIRDALRERGRRPAD